MINLTPDPKGNLIIFCFSPFREGVIKRKNVYGIETV